MVVDHNGGDTMSLRDRPIHERRIRRVLILNHEAVAEDKEVGRLLEKAGFQVIQMPCTPAGREQLQESGLCIDHDFTMIIYNARGLEVEGMVKQFGPV